MNELDLTELACNKSTQLHNAFIGHARQRPDLIGCSKTKSVHLSQFRSEHVHSNTALHTAVHKLEFASAYMLWTSLKISDCKRYKEDRQFDHYRAMLCIRGTSHGPLSVRLSVCLSVRHKSEFY